MIVIIFRWLHRIRQLKVPGDADNLSYYLATSIIGSLIGYFVCATFLSTAYYPQLWTMYMLAMSLIFVVDRTVSEQMEPIRENPVASEQAR